MVGQLGDITNKQETTMNEKKFTFAVHFNGYHKDVIAYAESKWLAQAKVRKMYPGNKFDLIDTKED